MGFVKRLGGVAILTASVLQAADFYVATDGSDSNAGSVDAPYQTISKAVSVMDENDICHVYGGVYRETVDFSGKSGLTVKAVDGEQVTVSGLDEVSGWVNESGNIWYASVDGMLTRDITLNSNIPSRTVTAKTFESQVYKDDSVQFLARWPNKQSTDYAELMTKDWYVMTQDECGNSDPEQFSFAAETLPAEWDGADFSNAYFWANVQNEWCSWMVPVANYDSVNHKMELSTYFTAEDTVHTWIRTKHHPSIKDGRPNASKKRYGHVIILGAKVLLDDENEFFTDFDNNRLYIYSADPASHNYEVKTRSYAFLLPSTASNITIEDIDVRSATVQIDGNNCVIKGSTLDFPSYGYAPYLNNMSTAVPGLRSVAVNGSSNVFRDSTIENCFGGAFEVNGSDNFIHNCVARNLNTMASWHSGIVVSGIRNTVSNSTVSKVGRSGFSITNGRNGRVLYNDVSDVGYLTDDLGGLHSSRDAQNTEIAYNWFHDIQTGNAIYMDNYNSHYIVHHNVIWNAFGHGVNHNRPSNHSFIINNTVLENWAGFSDSSWTGIIGQRFGPWSDGDENGKQQDSSYGSMWFNNLARGGIKNKTNRRYYGFQIANNATLSSDLLNSQVFDPTEHQVSSAADSGIYVKGITSEFVKDGKPDKGAYEITNSSADAMWTAGHDFDNPPELPVFKESKLVFRNLLNNGTFYYETANAAPEGWSTSSNVGDSILVKNYAGYNDPPANQRNSVLTNSLSIESSTIDTTFVEKSVTGLESKKYYNFSAYVRLYPHGSEKVPTAEDIAAGVEDVTLYVKDSNGVELGSTTVTSFPNYAGSTDTQEWFMTEVAFELPEGETEVTVGFSTDFVGNFFVDNVGLARKFSLAPVVDSDTIPAKTLIHTSTPFSVAMSDADSSIVNYKWTIDGTTYEGNNQTTVNHTFTELKENVEVSVVATDEFGVESMPLVRTVEVVTEVDPTLTASDVILDTQDINANPVVIQPSIRVDVEYIGSAYDTLSLYIAESEPVSLDTPTFEKSSITDFSAPHKLFIPSNAVKDGVNYHYVVAITGSGKDPIQITGTFTIDRMNMVPFADSRALTHLASSDRRLNAGTISTWQNLLPHQDGYDAVTVGTDPTVKDDEAYTVKGMKSILFNQNGMVVNTTTDTGTTAFVAARRQQAEVDSAEGDKHQRVLSVYGTKNDYTAGSGGWSIIERLETGYMNVFDSKVIVKSASDYKQGPLYIGRSSKKNENRYIGEVFEVVVFDEVLSSEESAVISQWLTDKWVGASFPQPTLDWDGDGVTNADEITAGTDPSVEEIEYPEMKTEWLAPIQNKSKKKLWWSIRVEQGVKHYLIQIDGQDITVPASKPDGGLYEIDLPVKQVVSNFYAVGYDGTQLRVGVWQQDSGAAPPTDPLANIDENLPSILMIGDSISIGYDDEVRTAMNGIANIVHNPGNGADTRYGVNKIDEWLYREWDIIHFNWGLHDLKRLDGLNVGVEIMDYKANLQTIIDRMRALNPNAKLIFATTTPYPDGVSPTRDTEDAANYNTAALEVMSTNGIEINDLYGLMMTELDTNGDGLVTNAEDTKKLQIDTNVHFTDAGSQMLADEVVVVLNSALSSTPAAPVMSTLSPSNFVADSAQLNGRLTNYGNQATSVWVYWGDDNAGEAAGNWDNSYKLSDANSAPVDYNHTVSSLTDGTQYYYRFYATNSSGDSWGEVVSFYPGTTSVTLSVDTDLHITQNPGLPVAGLDRLIAGNRTTNGDCRIFIKFDDSALPANAMVTKATLRLYHFEAADNKNEDAYVHSIQSDWDVNTVAYNQAISAERTHVVSNNSYNQYVETDVTSLMNLDADHFGFSIRGPESGTQTGSYFHSSENTNKPELVIEYAEILTPARGVSFKQTGSLVEWRVEEEFDVKEYRIVDANGNVILTVVANGSNSYSEILPEGVGTVYLVVVDNSGNTQRFDAENGNDISVEYKLSEGWNLIAAVGDNSDFSELKKITAGSLWTWDGQKYVAGDNPQAHDGVWVYSKTAQSVVVHADKANATATLSPGWNLAGPSNNVAVPGNVLAVYSYDSKYESILGNYDLLYKGIGYWFFVTEETQIELDIKE